MRGQQHRQQHVSIIRPWTQNGPGITRRSRRTPNGVRAMRRFNSLGAAHLYVRWRTSAPVAISLVRQTRLSAPGVAPTLGQLPRGSLCLKKGQSRVLRLKDLPPCSYLCLPAVCSGWLSTSHSRASLAVAPGSHSALGSWSDCQYWWYASKFCGEKSEVLRAVPPTPSNRSFVADTQRHCAAKRAGERTPRGAMPLRAGQLRS
jgi:hypothetical protein